MPSVYDQQSYQNRGHRAVRAREPVVTLGYGCLVLTRALGSEKMTGIRACPEKHNPQL
jgi:hypothetical protein